MAHTTRTRYVNTGTDASPNAAGGNGTTNVSDPGGTDPNRAYATLFDAETAEDGDISLATGTDEDVIIECSGTKADATVAETSITGWTTDANCFITIRAASGHRASADGWHTDRYRLAAAASGIGIVEDYVRIEGLQISIDPTADALYGIGVTAANPSNIRISGCRIRSLDTDGTYYSRGIKVATGATVEIWNCIIEGFLGSLGAGIRTDSGTVSAAVYNCTICGCYTGLRDAAVVMVAKNCAVFNSTDDYNGPATIEYCASDDAQAGTGNQDFTAEATDWNKVFTDYTTGDFTLKNYTTAPCCVGVGTDNPGAGLYNDDINGDGRTSTWDIGADEYVAAGGSIVPQAMHHYKLQRRVF